MTLKLVSAKIKNFKSLGDVDLKFRDLTILVGANSSGKSNCLEALGFLTSLLVNQSSPPVHIMEENLRLNAQQMFYEITIEDDKQNIAEYNVTIQAYENDTLIHREYLKINQTQVIDINDGLGTVNDEDATNSQPYKSDSNSDGLALRDVGKYGNKPFTKELSTYIKNWEFYDVDPDMVRSLNIFEKITKNISKFQQDNNIPPSLNFSASTSQEVLRYWAIHYKDKFTEISQELEDCLQIKLNFKDKEQIITAIEEDGKEIPLSNMSDGTLRVIAYCILLYQPDIPTFIGIEEPERNFHPGILNKIAAIIKRLSKRTQVVFTTHSSQLLDCFSPEEISSEISVILLSKKGESGTKACLLDKLAETRNDLVDWMTDFGLGSAIYHSQLIEEVLDGEYV